MRTNALLHTLTVAVMKEHHRSTPDSARAASFDEDAALRAVLEGTATETGKPFFEALVRNVSQALGTYGAWVTEYLAESQRLRALAFWMGGQWVPHWEQNIAGTPCEAVVTGARLVHYPDKVLEIYPEEPDLTAVGAVSYLGVPLLDTDGSVLGHLAALDTKPMPEEPRALTLFQIFAARAAAELRRMRAERQVREREEKLRRLLDSAMDAIIDLDDELVVTHLNPAAEKVCGCNPAQMVGKHFEDFLGDASREKLRALMRELDARPEGQRYLWIPGGLEAKRSDGEPFPAEATLSRYELAGRSYYTLILRNVNERLEAERRIHALSVQTDYLREEIRSLQNFDSIVGRSPALLSALAEVAQVADTEASVLILGETGVGKELFARAIHAASRRRDKPLITVNCAAIPHALMESEFFGHEKGAFTGATARREGRFALANGGTLFLDEVGELPPELQAKLLRVLQEGEFEPLGSTRTRKVDVRVIAATHRNLKLEVENHRFREDLYYRLNVFPIRIPPLRERVQDIGLLATTFAERFANRMGRKLQPLTPACIARLKAYGWPGNVRELQNVIERAVITAQNGRMNLDYALPASPGTSTILPAHEENSRVLTVQEFEAMERDNITRALVAAAWKVSGADGAAAMLGMKPSTLSSRIKSLGIRRPS